MKRYPEVTVETRQGRALDSFLVFTGVIFRSSLVAMLGVASFGASNYDPQSKVPTEQTSPRLPQESTQDLLIEAANSPQGIILSPGQACPKGGIPVETDKVIKMAGGKALRATRSYNVDAVVGTTVVFCGPSALARDDSFVGYALMAPNPIPQNLPHTVSINNLNS